MLLTILFLNISCYSQISDFQKGLQTFNSENYEVALSLLKTYADDSSNCLAQYMVGFCYLEGKTSFANDSIAEHYLLLSSENKCGRAMGLLASNYFKSGLSNPQSLIKALVWAELAANYDPAQKLVNARAEIRKYMSKKAIVEAEKIYKQKKRILDKIDVCN